MVLVTGLRISSLCGINSHFSGPVHTLQQEITPEMVAAVQHDYEIKNEERKHSHAQHHGGMLHGRKHSHTNVEH